MAQFAPVAPINILRELKNRDLLGNYHLLLAHDVVAQPKAYEEVFKDSSHEIIMDNSVIELGHPVECHVMQEAVDIVGATYVALPDILSENKESLELTLNAAEEWANQGLSSFMAIPQGRTVQEFRNAIQELVQIEQLAILGIPKIAQRWIGSRLPILHLIRNEGWRSFPIHLLGFSDDLTDDLSCANYPGLNIRGIDSAVPLRYGFQGKELQFDTDITEPRGNFWEIASQASADELAPEIFQNVRNIRSWLV